MIDDIVIVNKRLKHKKDLKVIKKEAMKNMIEGPPINIENPLSLASLQLSDSKQESQTL